jgi:hypothetical protein
LIFNLDSLKNVIFFLSLGSVNMQIKENFEEKETKNNFIGMKLSNEELLKLKDIMIDIKTRNQSRAIRYAICKVAGEIE